MAEAFATIDFKLLFMKEIRAISSAS